MSISTEVNQGNFPFQAPDVYIGGSANSNVYGYQTAPLVVKTATEKRSRRFRDINHALRVANRLRRTEINAANRIRQQGIVYDAVPQSSPVIHSGLNGEISIARVQRRINDAKPLSSYGVTVLNLPESSLATLRGILKANLSLWKEEKKLFPLEGSTVKHQSYLKRVLNHLFPIFNSQNIITDSANNIYFIDASPFIEPSIKDIHKWMGKYLYFIGNGISLGLINGALKIKKK